MDENLPQDQDLPSQPRGPHGRFAPKPKLDSTGQPSNPLSTFLKNESKVTSTHDDKTLIDLHIGNPLRKITELLEEIKRQKAFSFTLKGSLGVMGVVLSLSVLGVLGTSHLLCDKGTQTKIGMVKILQIPQNSQDTQLGKLQQVIIYYRDLFTGHQSEKNLPKDSRVVLVTQDKQAIQFVPSLTIPFRLWDKVYVYATGQYDSCSQTLKIDSPTDVQLME